MNPEIDKPEIPESDEQLLTRIAEQDRQALTLLYDRYRNPLGAFIRRKLHAARLIDEAYNDVMFTVWRKASGFRGDSKASTWIFGIAYRVCLTLARKESRHTANRSEQPLDELEPAHAHATGFTMVDELETAIAGLNENHRTVIELAYFHDKSMLEIADIIAVPVNTVKTRLYHARQSVKQHLQQWAQGDSAAQPGNQFQ